MNKKIFTLVVLFLATTFMASAQVSKGDTVKFLPKDNSGHLYQMSAIIGGAATEYVLSVNEHNALMLDPLDDATVNFGASLWCINVEGENGGKSANYDFTNKSRSINLVVGAADTALITKQDSLLLSNGYLGGWGFSNAFETNLGAKLPLYTHFKQDSILVLVAAAGKAGGAANVVGVKAYGANELAAIQISGTEAGVLYFTMWTPAEKILTAKEFNTLLDTTKYAKDSKPGDYKQTVQLTFNPEKTYGDNLFSATKLEALNSDSTGYVFLRVASGSDKGKFVFVDTNYVNTTGQRFLGFALGDTASAKKLNPATGNFVNQFLFKLKYNVSNDSLSIQANAARFNLLDQANRDHNTYEAGNNYAENRFALVPVNASGYEGSADSLTVKLQDLTDDLARITIGRSPANTKVELGYKGCEASSDATTVATDLYTIQNSIGQYLAMPIYKDSINGTTLATPMWVTIDEKVEDPTQMPSYQWIVKQVRDSKTSPVTIQNREYAGAKYNSTQLTTKGIDFEGAKLKADGFTAMSSDIKSNKYLGYKHITMDEAKVTTYTLRYLHGYNSTEYLGVTSDENDTLLYVMGASTRFEVYPYPFVAVGDNDNEEYGAFDKDVKDLVQLERMSYFLKVKDGTKINKTNKFVCADAQKRYALRSDSLGIGLFYLKTNNTTGKDNDKENFFALVDVWSADTTAVKAGVNDANLQVRIQNRFETRTSAFAISPADEPLYRRFNTKLEEQEGSDAPLTLEFFRMNEPLDRLYEDAWSEYSIKDKNDKTSTMGINFLGVKNHQSYPADEFFNYAIHVDTAFVQRPATEGSSIETPKPQYLLGVKVSIKEDGTFCPEHGWNAQCGHDVPVKGYTRARYLINATVYADGKKHPEYLWNNEWNRLIFVPAIHQGDTLYILKDEYTYTSDDELGFVLDKEKYTSRKVYLGNNLHKDEVFQFRLIDDKDTKDFLIESENEDRRSNEEVWDEKGMTGTVVDDMIAPNAGGWVKIQNGVPVISRSTTWEQAITDAEIFNVEVTSEKPVSNETISTTDVQVIAVNGAVIVKNAAGKTVAISNILGKTLANTVINSDEATIAVPAGIVVVAVEGEEAVKAIVK